MPKSALLISTVAPAGALPNTLPVVCSSARAVAETAAVQAQAIAIKATVRIMGRRGVPGGLEKDAFMGIPLLIDVGSP
jgi:hypothetical protein